MAGRYSYQETIPLRGYDLQDCSYSSSFKMRTLEWSLIRPCPTVTVSEGVTAGISLVEQDDPRLFIPGPAKPVIPPSLLTF